jgi:UDP:flavonoid glycosyltransferase YjiC (YdhE family)
MNDEPDFKVLAEQTARERDRAIKAVRMAYRKHCLHDESIGWNELSDLLSEVLADDRMRREFDEMQDTQKAED